MRITDCINDINKLLRWEGQLNKTKLVWNQYRFITNPRQKNAFYMRNINLILKECVTKQEWEKCRNTQHLV
jgi:hypothetical protein